MVVPMSWHLGHAVSNNKTTPMNPQNKQTNPINPKTKHTQTENQTKKQVVLTDGKIPLEYSRPSIRKDDKPYNEAQDTSLYGRYLGSETLNLQ